MLPQRQEPTTKLSIDVLRGIAIIGVYFVHLYGATFGEVVKWSGSHIDFFALNRSERVLYLSTLGHLGVALFFVLSGYCIHLSFLSYERKHGRGFEFWPFLKSFFLRRFFRIYPAYLFALLFFLYWGNNYSGAGFITQALAHLALVHNVSEPTMNGINAAFWSLAYEWQLYCLFPAFLLLRRRVGVEYSVGISLLVSLVFTLLISRVAAPAFALRVFVLKTGYMFPWYAGVLLSERHRQNRRVFPKSPSLFSVSLLIGVVLSQVHVCRNFEWEIWTPIFAWMLELYNDRTRFSFAERGVAAVGVVSYSFYLLHLPLLEWLLHRFQPALLRGYPFNQFTVGGFVLIFLPIFAISWVVHRFIEKPFQKLGVSLSNAVTKPRVPMQVHPKEPAELSVASIKA
jgi:peptidoglycan/LPS O-acetylase OafA/YrhL